MLRQPYQDLSEEQLLALCAWREADSQGVDAMRAVAHVVMNRVAKPGWWGFDVHSVILCAWQFSSFDHDDPGSSRWPDEDNAQWIEAQHIAIALLRSSDEDLTAGATNYYSTTITPPSWTSGMQMTLQVGNLRFYRA